MLDDARVFAAVKVVADLVTKPYMIGVDFADMREVLGNWGGLAACGHGTASGPDRAVKAAEAALADLLDQLDALAAGQGRD